jgi:hypothetical protein
MTIDEANEDAAMSEFFDNISEELYPEHKEQAINEFIEELMQSYYLNNPDIIQAPMDCYHHANDLLQISPQGALIIYTTAIELFLKSVLLKPILYGMIHNENIANTVVNATTGQSGFGRYNKLLSSLCLHSVGIKLSEIKGIGNKPILTEAEEVQKIRNLVVHQGSKVTEKELGKARSTALLILTEVVEPVLNNLNLAIGSYKNGFGIVKIDT